MESDTIFAPITALGGSVNVLRISGALVPQLLASLDLKLKKPRYLYLCAIKDPSTGKAIDSAALVAFFPKPHSFTGEDVLEISLHGGGFILRQLYGTLTNLGCRFALPGEFTKRALLNHKIDLLQAEGINLLVRAETQKQHDIAAGFVDGKTLGIYKQWREGFIHMMALLESVIDFPDESESENPLQRFNVMCRAVHGTIADYLRKSAIHERIVEGVRIALVGKPNVGKSSIMNLLAKKEAAIVSNIPGTTRDVIEVTLSLHGYLVTFIDTAGLRDTDSAVELEGIRRSKLQMQNSDLNLVVIDAKDPCQNMIAQCRAHDILVVNKIDLLTKVELAKLKSDASLQQISQEKIAYISTLTGSADELIDRIITALDNQLSTDADAVAINQRHRNLLSQMSSSLQQAMRASEVEIAAECLRQAIYNLDHIVGKIVVDDILDVIFSEFCIGK
jgi:tRNA modification GTPase